MGERLPDEFGWDGPPDPADRAGEHWRAICLVILALAVIALAPADAPAGWRIFVGVLFAAAAADMIYVIVRRL